jgi:hypothetical protein
MLASESVASERRTRTLGLGAAVRAFNDLAVPGMGGVWFGKQLFLAALGVAVGQEAARRGEKVDNIKVANAIEALACWMEHQAGGSQPGGRRSDERLRGIQKIGGVRGQPTFAAFSQANFYVSQPMRMATVQAVKALGLVSSAGDRFNSYVCAPAGSAFIDAVCAEHRPRGKHPLEALVRWVCGDDANVSTAAMRAVLSPTQALPPAAIERLRELVVQGEGAGPARRRAALDWIDGLADGRAIGAAGKPPSLSDEHWHDVQAGALFFALQADAYRVLDAVEVVLAARAERTLALAAALVAPVRDAVAQLRASATLYLAHGFRDFGRSGANDFATACAADADLGVLEALLLRDERVLRLHEGMVVPGQAFDPAARADRPATGDPDDPTAPAATGAFPLPKNASYRLSNLYLLNLDLRGRLDRWLDKTTPPAPGTTHGQA